MARTLKTTGIYANLVACIGVEDDNTTVKDFKVPSRTVTLSAGVTVVDGAYGRGVRVISSAGAYTPRGIELSPVITQANSTGTTRTSIIIFNNYTTTNDGRRYYAVDTTGGNGWRIAGSSADGEYPRLSFGGTAIFNSTKNIKNFRSMVAMAVDYGTTKAQRFWVAVNGEAFPASPEHSGTDASTSLTVDSLSLLGGSQTGSQSADWFLFMEFDIALTHSQVETIYNSLTGAGACDCFVPPAAPTITVEPTNQTVTAPAPATFPVTATGDGNSYQWQRSTDSGATWNNVGTASSTSGYTTGATAVSGGSHNNGDRYRVRVSNAGGGPIDSASATLTVNAPADSTPPTLTGTITVTSVTTTSYTLSWPTGSDNVAVTAYEYSLNGGVDWNANGTATTVNITSRTPGATDQVRVRAKDAANNYSTPVLSTSVTLGNTSITLGPFASNGTVWPSGTAIHVSWLPAGRIGSLGSVTPVDRTATLGAGGTVAVTGLPAGAGIAMVAKRVTNATDDEVCYQPGTVA